MNDGISFTEACKTTPQSLTAEQLQNCEGQESTPSPYVYVGIAILLVVAVIVFIAIRSKASKKSS